VIKEEDDFVKPVKPKIDVAKPTKIPKDTRLISEKQNKQQPPSRSKSLA